MEEMLHEKCRNPAELVLVHILVCPSVPRGCSGAKMKEMLLGLKWQRRGCRSHGDAGSIVGPGHEGTWALAAAGPQMLSGFLNALRISLNPHTDGFLQ